MPNSVNEILCVTATLNGELLCVQIDDTQNMMAVARDDHHMADLLQELHKLIPIDFDAVQLHYHPESEVLHFLNNTLAISGVILYSENQIAILNKATIKESGVSPYLYYNVSTTPIYYSAVTESNNLFFLAYNDEDLFSVTFGGYDNLLLIAKNEEEMSELASFIYSDSPFNFSHIKTLTCEQMSEDKILEIIKNTPVDGILLIDAAHELSAVLKPNVLRAGIQACFNP